MRSSSRDADSSFDALYRRYRAAVYRSALRDTGDPDEAEDVTQSTFLGAYRAFEHGRRPENPRQWLLTIARNICGRRFRARIDSPHEVPLDGALSDESTPEDVPAAELRAAFERLPENQLRVLVLREIRGLSYSEIGLQLGMSIPAAQMQLFRARRALRRELEAADVPLPLRQGLGALLWRLLSRVSESPSSVAESASPAALAATAMGAAAIATSVVVAVGAPLAHRRNVPRPSQAAPLAAHVLQPVLHDVERPRAAVRVTPNPAKAPTAAGQTATEHPAAQPPPSTSTRPPSDQPAASQAVSSVPLPQAPSAPRVEAPSLPPVEPPWLPPLDPTLPQTPALPAIPVPDPGQVAPVAPAPGVAVPTGP